MYEVIVLYVFRGVIIHIIHTHLWIKYAFESTQMSIYYSISNIYYLISNI
nr:MAG TPA: hypothetical protein [Caudoviricetes sp.]